MKLPAHWAGLAGHAPAICPLSKGMLRRGQMVTNLPNIRLLRCHSSHSPQKVFPLRKKILDKIKKTVILMQGIVY